MNESINAQSQALFLTALYTGYRAAESGAKVFFGSNSTTSRSELWTNAYEKETHMEALSNRVQVVIGSDSLYTRVTNLVKSVGFGISTIFSLGIIGLIAESKEKLNQINIDLSNCKNNLSEINDLIIEKGQVKNQLDNCQELLDACQPQLQKVNGLFGSYAEALASKAKLDVFSSLFADTTAAENTKRDLGICETGNKGLQIELNSCRQNLAGNNSALAEALQSTSEQNNVNANQLAAYQEVFPTVEDARSASDFFPRCSELLQEKANDISSLGEQQMAIQGDLDTCSASLEAEKEALAAKESELNTCNTNKATIQGDLGTCSANLKAEKEAFVAKESELNTCNTNKATIQEDLDNCNAHSKAKATKPVEPKK